MKPLKQSMVFLIALVGLFVIVISPYPSYGDPPTPADLAETIEVKFTPPITELAASLNNNPVKMLSYVRKNVEFKPYYGSVKGAQETLWEKEGNDFDQASLLIALLRTSGIPARYVYGQVDVPIERAKRWVGVTDGNVVGDMFASGGIPSSLGFSGGAITKLRTDHVWVEAWLTYNKYEGAIQTTSNKKWVPLDPSFAQSRFVEVQGVDITAVWNTVGWDPQNYSIPEVASPDFGAVVNEQQLNNDWMQAAEASTDWVVNLPSETPLPPRTYQVLVREDKDFRALPVALPYAVRSIGSRFSEIAANRRYTFTLDIAGAQYTASLPELAAKQLTLSYVAATEADQAILNAYDNLADVPANQVQMKPIFQIDHAIVLTGPPAGLGTKQTLTITLASPSPTVSPDAAVNAIVVGSYQSIGLDLGIVPDELLQARSDAFDLLVQDPTTLTDRDQVLGHVLWTTAMYYFRMNDAHQTFLQVTNEVVDTRSPSMCLVALELDVSKTAGIPTSVQIGAVSIDVDLDLHSPFERKGPTNPPSGATDKVFRYNMAWSVLGSMYEHQIFEELHGATQTMSGIKGIQQLNAQGIPTYTVVAETIADVLPLLNHPASVKSEVQQWVSQGYMVFIPQQAANVAGNNLSTYFLVHRETGVGGGMLNEQAGGGGWNGVFSKLNVAVAQCVGDWLRGERGTGLATCGTKIIEALEEYSPAVKAGSRIAKKLINVVRGAISLGEQLIKTIDYGMAAIVDAYQLYHHVPPLITQNQYRALVGFTIAAAAADTLWSQFVHFVFGKAGGLVPGETVLQEAGSKLAQNFVGFALNLLNRTAQINSLINQI